MSDVSKTNQLIEEAREFLASENAQYYDSSLVKALADALELSEKRRAAVLRMYDEVVEVRQVDEAAARVPVQGEPKRKVPHTGPGHAHGDAHYCEGCLAEQESRKGEPNDDREAMRDEFRSYLGDEIYVCSRDHSAWSHGTMGLDDFSLAAEDDEIIESLVSIALSRATVPDAAKTIAELKDYSMRTVDHGLKVIDQRDAALAAVARVRAIPQVVESDSADMAQGWADAMGAMLQALDGAPEPEWEYGLGNRKSPQVGGSPHPEARARWLVSELEVAPNFEPQLVRRRPAGPWLPVEGESKS